MTVDELEAYLEEPDQRVGRPPTAEQRRVTTNVERALGEWLYKTFGPGLAELAKRLDPQEVVTPATPGTGESVTDWLCRLGWLRVADERVRTTPLGDALLRHLEQTRLDDEVPLAIVLDQGDELGTARVIQQIAEVGQCVIVDRYFSMESLLQVLYSTEAEGVLMGVDAGAKLSGVQAALQGLKVERRFEVRKSDVFHDRFVVPPTGPVWALGTSLTGVSKRLSLMVEIKDDAVSDAVRSTLRNTWETAEVVAAKEPERDEGERAEAPEPPSGSKPPNPPASGNQRD